MALRAPADGSGAVDGYAGLSHYIAPGGPTAVFALPERERPRDGPVRSRPEINAVPNPLAVPRSMPL